MPGTTFHPSNQIAKSISRNPKAKKWILEAGIERSLSLNQDPDRQHPPAVSAEELDLVLVSAHDQLTLRCHTGMMRLLLDWPRT